MFGILRTLEALILYLILSIITHVALSGTLETSVLKTEPQATKNKAIEDYAKLCESVRQKIHRMNLKDQIKKMSCIKPEISMQEIKNKNKFQKHFVAKGAFYTRYNEFLFFSSKNLRTGYFDSPVEVELLWKEQCDSYLKTLSLENKKVLIFQTCGDINVESVGKSFFAHSDSLRIYHLKKDASPESYE